MSRRRVTVTEKEGILVVRGWQVGQILADAGIKAVFSASAGGHMVDGHRLPDVMAALEYRSVATVYVNEIKAATTTEIEAPVGASTQRDAATVARVARYELFDGPGGGAA